jgi:hypothetical protein
MRVQGIRNHTFPKFEFHALVSAERSHVVDVHFHAFVAIGVLFGLVPFILGYTGRTEVGVKLVGREFESESHGGGGVGGAVCCEGLVEAEKAEIGPVKGLDWQWARREGEGTMDILCRG